MKRIIYQLNYWDESKFFSTFDFNVQSNIYFDVSSSKITYFETIYSTIFKNFSFKSPETGNCSFTVYLRYKIGAQYPSKSSRIHECEKIEIENRSRSSTLGENTKSNFHVILYFDSRQMVVW